MKDVASHAHGSRGTIFTIGHSTRTLSELMDLLREAQIELLVDVRSVPRSRTNPQFNIDALPEALAAAGIGYRSSIRAWRLAPSPQDRDAFPQCALAERILPKLCRLRRD